MTYRKGDLLLIQCDGDPNWDFEIVYDDGKDEPGLLVHVRCNFKLKPEDYDRIIDEAIDAWLSIID